MDPNSKFDPGYLFTVEKKSRDEAYQMVEQTRNTPNIEEYKDAYRRLYLDEAVFKTKKSKEYMEKTLQELNPALHYNDQAELILKNVAKMFLIELFEEAIEVREKKQDKREIDEQVLEDAYRRLKKKTTFDKF